MLNLVITQSPRLAAMSANKPLGEDVARHPMFMHRLAWARLSRERKAAPAHSAPEGALREQHALTR